MQTRELAQSSNSRYIVACPLLALVVLLTNVLNFIAANSLWWMVVFCSMICLGYLAKVLQIDFSTIGLSKDKLKKGLVVGALASLIVAAVMISAFIISPDIFADTRYDLTLQSALLSAIFIIPLKTILIEELIFRGVIWGLISKYRSPMIATSISAIIFGFWHILPALSSVNSISSISGSIGGVSPGSALIVIATILATTVAGFAFGWLRQKSGSLVAPILAHWTINAGALMLAYHSLG